MEEGVIHLGIILQLCPKLHFLSIERPEGANQIEDNSATSGQDSDPEFKESKIEYLIINGVYIEQSTLETIIRRCPQLRVLKLINIALQGSSARPFDRNAFNEVVATSCQQLRYFHLSICHQRITLEEAEAFYRTFFPDVDASGSNLSGFEDHAHHPCQKAPAYNLNTVSVQDIDINQDTTPFILAPLLDRYLRNTVTTLEIINTGDELFTVYLSDLLHNFMCTATCLLHLIAPAVNYYAEYFDLSGPSAGTGYYYPRSCASWPTGAKSTRLKKQIWACRRLRTLQIKVKSKDLMDNPSEKNSRIMFGYISLVCPNLRELVIDRAQLNLGLEGGFCFLSRLHSLERLTVSTRTLTTLDRRDLEWMSKKPTMIFKSRQRSDSTSLYREWTELQDVGPIEKLYSCREQHSDGMGEQDCWPILEFLSLNFRLLWKGKTATLEDYLPAMISEIRPGLEIHFCKLWYFVSRYPIRACIVKDDWSTRRNGYKALSRIPLAKDVYVDPFMCESYFSSMELWDHLIEKIEANKNKLRIKRLELNKVAHIVSMVYPILPAITTLTDIHITNMHDNDIHLGKILMLCPSLLRFYATVNIPRLCKVMDNTSNADSDTASQVTFNVSGIKYLTLKGMSVEQRSLEAILSRCPQLQALRLEGIRYANPVALPFDRAVFYRQVSKSCPRLKRFHFSVIDNTLSPECAMTMDLYFFKYGPIPSKHSIEHRAQQPQRAQLDTISVLDTDIDRLTSQILFGPLLHGSLDNTITTLEITTLSAQNVQECGIHALHNVLCTSASLLHLIAPWAPYFLEYFDFTGTTKVQKSSPLWECSSGCPAAEANYIQKRVWACRGLRTLQLRFIAKFKPKDPNYSMNPRYSNGLLGPKGSAGPEDSSQTRARIIFGYISTVCPNLSELEIYYTDLDLGLAGGFCFLSRLKFLQRLTVGTRRREKLKGEDLDWMARDPQKKIQSDTGRNNATRSMGGRDIGESKPDLESMIKCLEGVASKTNVEVCRRQLKSMGGEGCWPMLEYLCIRHSFKDTSAIRGDYLSSMIAEFRPSVEFSSKFVKN
ncbi:hypothetical protein BGZ79_001598 [Entomortierella chlamydospora]|nr:hypothetical protein BGZ79_001598 [Entomortierella chlamydospora]